LLIDKQIDAGIGKDSAQGRSVIQRPVAKRIDAVAGGTGAGGANSNISIHLLRPYRGRGKRGGEYDNGDSDGPQAAFSVFPERTGRRAFLDGDAAATHAQMDSPRRSLTGV
jgi:hypothetical protein